MATPRKTRNWKLKDVLRIVNSHDTDEEAATALGVAAETLSRYLSKHRDEIKRIRCYKVEVEAKQ